MKKINFIIVAIVLVISSFSSLESFGQKKKGPPPWAPANGYRAQQARYFYFPEHNFYYDTDREVYYYPDGHDWNLSSSLPTLFAWIDLGNSMKVALNYNGDRPYRENHYHSERYRHKDHHKAWKKENKEWEKREKEWAKEYRKRHKKCDRSCGDYAYEEEDREDKPNGRVRVEVRF